MRQWNAARESVRTTGPGLVRRIFGQGRFLLCVAVGFAACARPRTLHLRLNEPEPASSYLTPDAEAGFARYRTFSVVPFADASGGQAPDLTLDGPLLFFVRNQMERKGYVFAPDPRSADFLITEKVFSRDEPVPPFASELPLSTGTAKTPVWGTHLPAARGLVLSSGTATFTGTVSASAPAALAVAYDGATRRAVWKGRGEGNARGGDPRISGQSAIAAAVVNLPDATEAPAEGVQGAIGARLGIYTEDGDAYLPTVESFPDLSPARDAGLKKGDRIATVNGQSLLNLGFHEATELIRGEPDTLAILKVVRGSDEVTCIVKRRRWSDVWGDEKAE